MNRHQEDDKVRQDVERRQSNLHRIVVETPSSVQIRCPGGFERHALNVGEQDGQDAPAPEEDGHRDEGVSELFVREDAVIQAQDAQLDEQHRHCVEVVLGDA